MVYRVFNRWNVDTSKIVKRASVTGLDSLWKSLFGNSGGSTEAGVTVTEENALKYTAIFASIRVLSKTIASLPFNVIEKTGNNREIATKHPVQHLIHSEPNDIMTSYGWREYFMSQMLTSGNAFFHIKRDKNQRPISLTPVLDQDGNPAQVTAKYKTRLFYEVEGLKTAIPARDMLHFPFMLVNKTVMSDSPIMTYAKESVGLGIALDTFSSKFFANGATIAGTLTTPGKLDDPAYERMRTQWNKTYGGVKKALKVAILEAGTKFEKIGVPPNEAQFIESKTFGISEISRIYGVPLPMLADMSRSTFNNIEQQSIDFVIYTLNQYANLIEAECDRKLFTEEEKRAGTHYVKLNMNGLLRGDVKSRSQFYKDGIGFGWFTQNEVRMLEDLNPMEGHDELLTPLNLSTETEKNTEDEG